MRGERIRIPKVVMTGEGRTRECRGRRGQQGERERRGWWSGGGCEWEMNNDRGGGNEGARLFDDGPPPNIFSPFSFGVLVFFFPFSPVFPSILSDVSRTDDKVGCRSVLLSIVFLFYCLCSLPMVGVLLDYPARCQVINVASSWIRVVVAGLRGRVGR
ncbi:hypothetical protein LY76DRAFT_287931 [Colletotrichum caudatum]|nr:hypothetical protein LY76DRAFT_287931 [Colletotrichum caudatum]